jgi:uncharacterized membrane protein YfhO
MSNPGEFNVGDVVVEQLDTEGSDRCKVHQRSRWRTVAIQEDRGDIVRLAPVKGPAFLVLNDSFYPGWTARDVLTGRKLEIKPANVNFRSVFVPEAQSYEVEFIYRPPWLRWSQLLAVVALICWIAAASVTLRRTPRADPRMR